MGRGCGKEWRGGRRDGRLVADKGVDQTSKHFRANGSQVSLTVEWEATDKQGVEAIKIHVVMELNTSLLTHVLA